MRVERTSFSGLLSWESWAGYCNPTADWGLRVLQGEQNYSPCLQNILFYFCNKSDYKWVIWKNNKPKCEGLECMKPSAFLYIPLGFWSSREFPSSVMLLCTKEGWYHKTHRVEEELTASRYPHLQMHKALAFYKFERSRIWCSESWIRRS